MSKLHKTLPRISKIKVIAGHFHHIYPQIYGGINDFSNACLLCIKCHIKIHSGAETEEKYIIHMKNFYQNKKLLYGTA